MPINTKSTPPNPLTPALLDTIRLARARGVELLEVRTWLRDALAVIAERDRALDHLRAENIHLRAQLRAALSGRTIAEERQAIEREALDGDWLQDEPEQPTAGRAA